MLLLAALLSFAGGTTSRAAEEFRAAWADIFHVGLTSQADVDTMVAALVAGRYNVVVAQVLGYMDSTTAASHGAHWKSSIVPWSSRVTASFDPLAYLCTKAHANGIEVHAWIGGSGGAMYRVSTAWPPAGNATLAAHPEWFIAPLANSEGNAVVAVDGNYVLDMGSPDAQEYIVSIVKELVTNYPIDGINWDDEINGTGYNAGFNYPAYSQANYARSGLARFRINSGYASTYTPSNTDTAWSNYRRRFKNELMARVQAEMQSIKTNPRQPLRHTTAALAYSPVPASCDFTTSTPYLYFCDWARMLQNGWVDAVIPQTYSTSTISNWVDRITECWQYNRQVFPGIGAYLNPNATIANHIYYLRSKGLKGYSTYSYAVANNSGTPSDWWAYAAANVNTTVVSTPTMSWRNPATATEGILWGRVTDYNTGLPVDDATVNVTGWSTVKTDGNGYYVATLVPATAVGIPHTTTVSKTGMTSQTVTAIVLAGDVVRYDLTLNPPANNPPSITSQPQDQTVSQGASATFTVGASGTEPLSYQWRWHGTNLSGATASSYTRANAQPADAGPYSVVITNAYGTATSSNALLTVIVPPTITAQPSSQTVTQGTAATFSVAVSGTAPLSYQWRFNGTNLSGATTSAYIRGNAQFADAGSYSVIVTNTAGSATSSNAILTVAVAPIPPAITTQPQGQTVLLGGTASFNVVATGTAPLSYQWRFNGVDIGGATASAYARANLQGADSGDYSVLVTNLYGSVLSSNATLVVDTNITLPVITAQPQSQTVIAGQSATFTVTATNKAPMSYQWRFNSAPIAGATGTAYTVANAQTANAGSYSVVITNIIGASTSADAVLTVNFSLTATATAGGTVSKSPDQASYAPNAVVTLTATTNAGYLFAGWSGDATGTDNPLSVTMTTNKTIAANFTGGDCLDIILDNTNAAVTFSGEWQAGTASTDKYGTDYRFASTAAGGVSNVIYRPYICAAGYYDVFIWYPQGSNRATNAPWSVVYDGGSINVPVNQQTNGGGWVAIGTALPFAQGTSGYVMLSNDTGYSGFVVLADAVRFVRITNITLTATAAGGGAVYKYPDQATYESDSMVSLIAAPVLGWNFTGWSGGASGTANPLMLTLTHPLSITANFTSTVADLIVDNTQATTTGSWTVRTTGTGYYSNNFQTAGTRTGSANATSTFTPAIVTAGNYDVYVWYPTPTDGTTSANAPFLISYDGGTTNVAVNQQTSQQTWRLLASGLKFAAGTSGYVQLANNTGESSRRVLADAVRWVYSANQSTAPVIIAQPLSQSADTGGAATFTASAAGTAPLGYQWRLNGTPIGGATDSAYTRSNLQPGDAGTYSLVVTNAVGSVASSNAVLTVILVNVAPAISEQPQDQNVNQGSPATFTVMATGTPAPAYQWRFNGTNISGATDSSYVLADAQPANAGGYSVVVTNVAGSVTSSNAMLSVNVAPALATQPQDQNVNQGSNAVFSVVATGTPAPSYQWRKNGTPIGGATGTSYTVADAQPGDAGSYSVVVSNIAGTVPSANAVLTVNVAPAITTQPADQNVNQTSNAVFSVEATGTPAPSYQWRKDGTPIGGATGTSYTVANAQPGDAGSYSVVVSNIAGTVPSANAVLTVNVAPAITTQPADQNVNQTSNAVFSVEATGTPAPAYQWRFNGTNISGATDSSYVLADAQPANAGSYSVVVSNVAGTVTSADAVLTVNVPPGITGQPQSVTVAIGSNVTFTVTATGTLPLGYQWRFNGTNLAAATDSAYTRADAQLADAGSYSVIVSNLAGMVTSDDAVLSVTQPAPPQIDSISLTSEGQIQLQVSGAPGCYAVDGASNLTDWVELATVTNTGSSFQYLDPETNLAQRLYRVRLVP